jgi:hypothetical protein
MEKITIELYRTEITNGYDDYPRPYEISEQAILDKIVEFSQGKNIKVYRHHFWKKWEENTKKYGWKTHFTDGKKLDKPIPKGDLIYYLDIYYQTNLLTN